MPNPSIVIAGAAKCGTTALAAALGDHPDIFVGHEKEPRFFCDMEPTYVGPMSGGFNSSMITDQSRYSAMFSEAAGRHTLDASTDYLAHPECAARIHQTNPDAKIIVGLRHPVRRAYSQHTHLVREGLEDEAFEHALVLEDVRVKQGWVPLFHHVGRSKYAPGLQAFVDTFGKDQVFVYMHEDFVASPEVMLQQFSRFLQLDTPLAEPGEHNVSGVPRSKLLNSVLRPQRFGFILETARKVVPSKSVRARLRGTIDRVNLDRPDHPSSQAARYILERVESDIVQVENILGTPLPHWREIPGAVKQPTGASSAG